MGQCWSRGLCYLYMKPSRLQNKSGTKEHVALELYQRFPSSRRDIAEGQKWPGKS